MLSSLALVKSPESAVSLICGVVFSRCVFEASPRYRNEAAHRPYPCFERVGIPPEKQLSAIPSADEAGVAYFSNFRDFPGEGLAGPVFEVRGYGRIAADIVGTEVV